MRILKTKVAKAAESLKQNKINQKAQKESNKIQIKDQQIKFEPNEPRSKRDRRPPPKFAPSVVFPPKGSTSCKNIMKNYSQAIVNFALCPAASSYLERILAKSEVKIEDFRQFVETHKEKAHCIKGLRALLLAEESDSSQLIEMKNVFKKISIIFLKYFSVNWIFNSRIADKMIHLGYRFKILRRIQNPIYFTYLQGFNF